MKSPLLLLGLGACAVAPLFAQAPAAPTATIPPRATIPPAATLPPKGAAPAESAAADSKVDVDPAVLEVMRKAFAAQRAKGSFRAHMESTAGAGEANPSVEMEFVFPDRMRMKMTGVEVVGVGDKTLVKAGEAWLPAPAALKSAAADLGDPKKSEELISSAVVAKSLGPTKVDNILPVEAYQLNTKTKEGLSRSKIYIVPATGLIQRIEVEADYQGQHATSRMDYYDYGAPIKIELPKQ